MEQKYYFRGRRADTLSKVWVYGSLLEWEDGTCEICSVDTFARMKKITVKRDTVCIFTGLYDCTKWEDLTYKEKELWSKTGKTYSDWKGRMIFSNDIVKTAYFDTPAVVQYIKGNFYTSGMFLIETYDETMKIIGNMYDNPEQICSFVVTS